VSNNNKHQQELLHQHDETNIKSQNKLFKMHST